LQDKNGCRATIQRWRHLQLQHEKIIPVIPRFNSFCAALVILAAIPASPSLASSKKADELAGAILFRDQDCAHCHTIAGVGGKKGPDLTNLPKDKLWTPEKIAHQILNGGQKMPPFSDALTDQQIGQIVAYLRAKHRPVAPPAPAAASAPPAN
jgi:mono/diheme cytochrome c family protein